MSWERVRTSATAKWVVPGEIISVLLPYSEVCMHMQIAGRVMPVALIAHRDGSHAAQIFCPDGQPHGLAVLPGEAGFFRHPGEFFYYYPPELIRS